ncbi:MAG: 3'(2'),5'-bisphosphate nucleotidase CysQ [Bacteroidales bacterium]
MENKQIEIYSKLAVKAAIGAGKKILEVYNQDDFEIEFKADNSPLTKADKAANNIITSVLDITKLPVISEEGNIEEFELRRDWKWYWLVDPLDGTKEFIKRNGEFTVNIALMHKTRPWLGIIYVPVLNKMYYSDHENAWMVENLDVDGKEENIFIEIESRKKKLPRFSNENIVILASKSHLSEETKQNIEKIKQIHPGASVQNVGSSLKFCYIAEGRADFYPRYGKTMEWDTAAGQAIVEAAGGKVIRMSDLKPMDYNKESLVNPDFIVTNQKI